MIQDLFRRWFGGGSGDDESRGGSGSPSEDCSSDENPCAEALLRLQELVDGELDEAARADVEAHFRACANCGPHLTMEEEFRKRLQEALQKPRCPDALKERILTMIQEEEG